MFMTDLSAALLSNTTSPSCGTVRWMSPELLDIIRFNSDGLPSRESDCYALGMTIYEVSGFLSPRALSLTYLQVLSALLPFYYLRSPVVGCAILRGERPEKPPNASSLGFTDALWELLQSCWSESAAARPTAWELLDQLRSDSRDWVPPKLSPTAEGAASTLSSDIFGCSGVSLSVSVCRVR